MLFLSSDCRQCHHALLHAATFSDIWGHLPGQGILRHAALLFKGVSRSPRPVCHNQVNAK